MTDVNRNPHRGRVAVRCATVLGLAFAGALAVPAEGASAKPKPPKCDDLTVTMVGTNGDDVIVGTPGDDVILAGPGNDTINGGFGDDVICGGPGNDVINGQDDDDRLFGGPGKDALDGGEGGFLNVAANTGDDFLSGGPGSDTLNSSDFPITGSTLHGDQGNDQLFLWSGGSAFGGNGNDLLRQFTGDAVLDGGNGADSLIDWDDGLLGGNETVTLLGGRGSDTLTSQDLTSISTLNGASGRDTCVGGDTTLNCEA